ncbi:MAG: stage III sporulation protein AD [Ruminococcus sp.]|nr:stage III sporulation protein AD [Ruminococcus sp.]
MIAETGSAAALCIIGAVLATLLKQYCREQAVFSSIAVCVMVVTAVITCISPVAEKMELLFAQTQLSQEYLRTLWKAVGICYITGIAADICRDSGEQALAPVAELWGRVSLLLLSLPMIDALLGLMTGVLE